jgi:hypothetical protein
VTVPGCKFGLSCNRSGVDFGLSCDRSGVEFGLSCDRSGVEFGLSCVRSGVRASREQSATYMSSYSRISSRISI